MAKENAARRFRLEDLAQTTSELIGLRNKLKGDAIYLKIVRAREKYKNVPMRELEKKDNGIHSIGHHILEYFSMEGKILKYYEDPAISELTGEIDSYIENIKELIKD